MHEMSIALGIVKIAEQEVIKRQAKYVSEIVLEIGELSGVELDSLDFIWPAAVKETVLESANRVVDYKQGKASCIDCDTKFDVHSLSDECPKCGSYFKSIVQGKEMRVLTLTIEHEKQKTI